MLHFFHETALLHNRLIQRLTNRVDRAMRHIGGIEYLLPLHHGFSEHDCGDLPFEFNAIFMAIFHRAKACIHNQVVTPNRAAELAPEFAHVQRQHDVPIFHRHQAIRHDVVMLVTHAAWALAGDQINFGEITQQAHQPFEQTQVNVRAFTGGVAFVQRRHHSQRRPQTAAHVTQRQTQLGGRAIGIAVDAHHAT